jgi:hypothetical protein
MELHITGFTHSLQTVAIATLFFAICWLVPKLSYHVQLAKLPVFGNEEKGEKQRQLYLNSAKKLYDEGYQKARIYVSPHLQFSSLLTAK